MTMRIIGFGIKRILGEKNIVQNVKLSISQNINIKDVYKEKLDINGQEAIGVDFIFSIVYSENIGKVEVEGNLLIHPEKEDLKEFSKSIKEKSIPDKFKPIVLNFIMSKCNIKALSIEDEINLPYHVPMPRLTPADKD